MGCRCRERDLTLRATGTRFPLSETTLRTAVRVPSSYRWYAALFKDLFVSVGHLCHESASHAPYSHRAQSFWLGRAPVPSCSSGGIRRCLVFGPCPLCVEGLSHLELLQVPVSFKPCRFHDNFSNVS